MLLQLNFNKNVTQQNVRWANWVNRLTHSWLPLRWADWPQPSRHDNTALISYHCSLLFGANYCSPSIASIASIDSVLTSVKSVVYALTQVMRHYLQRKTWICLRVSASRVRPDCPFDPCHQSIAIPPIQAIAIPIGIHWLWISVRICILKHRNVCILSVHFRQMFF